MDLPIERAYADSGWDVERLAVLPENWGDVRALRLVDGKLTYMAHERRGSDRFARAYAVYGDCVAGPYKHVEHQAIEEGSMLYLAVDMHGVKGTYCGGTCYAGAYEPCGEISMAFDSPLVTAMTPKGNYALVHGKTIVAHEHRMIWGGMFAKGKKFYLTGKANTDDDGGEFQAVWGDDRSIVYEALGRVGVVDGRPTFGARRRGFDFDVSGLDEKLTDRGFLACHLADEQVRLLRGRNEGEIVVWKGTKSRVWDSIQRESLVLHGGTLTYWAVDQLGLEVAVVGAAEHQVPDYVTRHSDRIELANGLPLYLGSYRRHRGREHEAYRLVVVCGKEVFTRHTDAHQLEFVDGKIRFLSVLDRDIVRLSRKL